ncbi:hypothetical protein DFJ58DRAFT_847707 [Suillus subalutaceus]|uniref:uncharacterized protein n=1 Tax=Suillus subalutaceus TaxID=48586 RepID=UPI001B876997|nr:uncharacterized protein DFJ58DRAFT_847707 [Suillus subalutaceus]KAG1834024.1 hypothetical protein DFJ58DRAFT_847707 [Suillus subalutaceus]
MSRRPSINSHVSHPNRRAGLTPMRQNHPNLRKLRRCTSLEWIYNTNDNPTDANGSMVIRVGEEYEFSSVLSCVSIYPLDERAVQMRDGSLPVMSYWYGKVAEIYLKAGRQDVWLDIQWYYRKVDLEDEGVDLAASVGEYELVLSDHISVVDMCCVEDHATILPYDEGDLTQPQIPIGRPYNRWTIDITFSRNRRMVYMEERYCRKCNQWFNEECVASLGRQLRRNVKAGVQSMYSDISFDPQFLSLLTLPIRRGASCGVVGNGMILVKGGELMDEARILGQLPEGWKEIMQQAMGPMGDENIARYYCIACTTAVI